MRGPEDFAEAFAAAARGHAGAIIAFDDPLILGYPTQVVALAAKHRLPAIYGFREFPEVGGLMSYGANRQDLYRRTAVFVDKILKGTKPADLSCGAADKVRVRHQLEKRQANRPDDSAKRAGKSG